MATCLDLLILIPVEVTSLPLKGTVLRQRCMYAAFWGLLSMNSIVTAL